MKKEELFKQIWPSSVVNGNNIDTQRSILRKSLEDLGLTIKTVDHKWVLSES